MTHSCNVTASRSCHHCFRLLGCWCMIWNLPPTVLQFLVRDKPVSLWMPNTTPVAVSCFPWFNSHGVCTGCTRNKADNYLFFLSRLCVAWEQLRVKNPRSNFYRCGFSVHSKFSWCLFCFWICTAEVWQALTPTLALLPRLLWSHVCVLCRGMDTWSAYSFEVTSLELCFLQTLCSKPLFAGDGQCKRDFSLRAICICAEIRKKIRAVVVEEPFSCKWFALDVASCCRKVAIMWWLLSVMWSWSL